MGRKKKEMPEDVKEWFRKQGKRGGKKRAANMSPEERTEAAKKAVAAREAKRKGKK